MSVRAARPAVSSAPVAAARVAPRWAAVEVAAAWAAAMVAAAWVAEVVAAAWVAAARCSLHRPAAPAPVLAAAAAAAVVAAVVAAAASSAGNSQGFPKAGVVRLRPPLFCAYRFLLRAN